MLAQSNEAHRLTEHERSLVRLVQGRAASFLRIVKPPACRAAVIACGPRALEWCDEALKRGEELWVLGPHGEGATMLADGAAKLFLANRFGVGTLPPGTGRLRFIYVTDELRVCIEDEDAADFGATDTALASPAN